MDETGISYQEQLEQRARREIDIHGNPYRAADYWNVSSAHFHNVLELGMDSPTLRGLWEITKEPPRIRLRVDCTPELRDEFHRRRGNMTGGEYLKYLLENAS